MKTLIIYYSHSGNNQELAKRLALGLGADLRRITEPRRRSSMRLFIDMLFSLTPRINPLQVHFSHYDHVILMAPIWDYRIANPMKTYLKKYGKDLQDYSFLTLCIGQEGQNELIQQQLEKWTGQAPRHFLEFRIKDLLPVKAREQLSKITAYKVEQAALDQFEPKLEQFIEGLKTFKVGRSIKKQPRVA